MKIYVGVRYYAVIFKVAFLILQFVRFVHNSNPCSLLKNERFFGQKKTNLRKKYLELFLKEFTQTCQSICASRDFSGFQRLRNDEKINKTFLG